MSNLIKPYEISIWEDILENEGSENSYFKEKKIAVIGSSTMESPCKVYDPVLHKNKNGEKTLSFSIKSRYYDVDKQDFAENPFYPYLINERKVKLYYDDKWYDFIIKEYSESSEEYEWHYVCQDAFVLELSKTGYNIEFNSELGNNQGSATQLATIALENTDWQILNIDVEPPKINEPIYSATLLNTDAVTIKNMDDDSDARDLGSEIFVFYSYVSNQDGNNVQFIEQSTDYDVDSNNNITATNYRIVDKLEFKNNGFYKGDIQVIALGDLYLQYQAYRIVYKQLSTYDPVMERTVDRYITDNNINIYHYADYVYTSSDVVTSYVANGSNFNTYDGDKSDYLQGWSKYTSGNQDHNPELNLTTFPEDMHSDLIPLESLKQAEGYIETRFAIGQDPSNLIQEGYLFNSGIENNAGMIGNIQQGERFLLRWRAAKADIISEEVHNASLKIGSLKIVNMTTEEETPISADTEILVFYSNLNNEAGRRVQFIIKRAIEEYDVDEQKRITDTNYLVEDDLEFVVDETNPNRTGFYKGQELVIQVRSQYSFEYTVFKIGGKSDRQLSELEPGYFGAVVGYYNKIDSNDGYRSFNELDTSKILFNFYASEGERISDLNNKLTSGHFTTAEGAPEGTKSFYVVDGVVQEPSTRYIYIENGDDTEYVWDIDNKVYKEKDSTFFNYYYLVAEASAAVTSEALSDPDTHIGIFFYINNEDDIAHHYYYFQDIQLTRYYEDANGVPVVLGEAPTAQLTPIDYFYVAPENGTLKESVDTYASLAALAQRLGISEDSIEPLYTSDDIVFWTENQQGEDGPLLTKSDVILGDRDVFYVKGYVLSKILSIEASKSNVFNILQTIAETFECWLDIEVSHDSDGAIELSESGKPLKYIYLRRYAGKDNFAGFKYGINLKSIERTLDSNEVVTKLIVDPSQNDLVDSGMVSIQGAESNIPGESYILNFDYFFNQNLLEREPVQKDYLTLFEELKDFNSDLRELEERQRNLSNSLNKIAANRGVYVTLLDTAKENLNRALDDFKRQSGGYDYSEYENLSQEEKDKILALLDNDTFMNTLGTIYSNAIVVNNYEGLSGVNSEEYERIRGELFGQKDAHFTVTRVHDSDITKDLVRLVLDDYVVPFKFTLGEQEYSTTINQKSFEIQIEREASSKLVNFVYGDKYENITNVQGAPVEEIIADENVQNFTLQIKEEKESIQDKIDELIDEKKKCIASFENKYSQYILEGNWSSNEYISDELYYLDALNLSRVSAFPKITYNISVVDISGIDEYSLYSFDAGDKTYVEDTEFFGWTTKNGILTPAREEVIVSEVEWHLDDPSSNSVTVQNYKTNFEDLFQRIQATVQTVQYNETTYPKTSSFLGEDGNLNESILLDSLNKISGKKFNLTSDGSVYIDEGTIIVKNLTNATNCVKINSEGIQITSDGGTTWSTAVSGQGIDIGKVFAGSINTKEIFIGNPDNASFFWDSNGINAYQLNATTGRYNHNTYVRFDEYGLYGIENGASLKLNSIGEVEDNANFGLTWNGFFIKSTHEGGGQVKISKEDDIQVLAADGKERVKIGYIKEENLYGIVLRDSNEEKTLWTDNNGNITLSGTIQSKNYSQINLTGWQINREGDATFNNVSVRGAIKTAVFEYSEVQAVGGIFLFRPSSSITAAKVEEDTFAPGTYNLKVKVDKPTQFESGDWCKISNYTKEIQTQSIVEDSGLVYIYKFDSIEDGFLVFKDVDAELKDKEESLIGGALISMGKEDGTDNYGIGINSSDSAVNLSPRAISLFETVIHPDEPIKVSYALRGILGTLPDESGANLDVNADIYKYLRNTQGIYTDNMYIGNAEQYVAFYTKGNEKRLDVTGGIHALSLTIGEGDDEYDGISAINASGYTIEIIRDDTAMPGYKPDAVPPVIPPDGTTYIYPVLYHNGVKAEEYILTEDTTVTDTTYYIRSGSGTEEDPYVYDEVVEPDPTSNPKEQGWYQKRKFVWYEDNSESGIVGDELHGGILALYDKSYRVTYTFTDDEVGEVPTVQTVTVDPSKYITKIHDRGIIIHPEFQDNTTSIQLDGTGLDIQRNGISVAKYGEIARIGRLDETRAEIDFHSLKLIDKEGKEYLYISDLRDESGEVERIITFIADGETRMFQLVPPAKDEIYSVVPDNDSGGEIFRYSDGFSFQHYPDEGTSIEVKYISNSEANKAYTLGVRNDGSYLGAYSFSTGDHNISSGYSSFAEGRETIASGEAAHAEGYKTEASGIYSHSEGLETEASGVYSHAEGYKTEASSGYSHAEGSETKASMGYSHAEGEKTIASGKCSHAEGYITEASGKCSHAEGMDTVASQLATHAEGYSTAASGPGAHAEGDRTEASGGNTHAEGSRSIASGEASHAEGYKTEASGYYSHSEGADTIASGAMSHAEGMDTVASGAYSHAEGVYTKASGHWSHAGGYDTEASGYYSTSIGDETVAQGYAQMAIGIANIPSGTQDEHINTDLAFIVGNGIDRDTRSNAFTIDWQGNVRYAGSSSQMSDRRLKDHQAYLNENEKANDFIRNLKPAYFLKDNKPHVGFYAQDVEKIDKWNCMTGEMNGFKTLGYMEIIAPLVAYCQHLEKRIEELEGGGN